MHDRFTYMWLKFIVNVGQYSIHGCYGYDNLSVSVYLVEATVDTPKSPVVLVVVDPAGTFRKHVRKKTSLSHRMHGMAFTYI